MKIFVSILIGLFLSTACADEFCLKHDATGKVYGPFQTDAGSKVIIGSTTFTVASKSTVETNLEGITIPQVEFAMVAFQDAVNFLKKQSQEHDPLHIGVNFVLVKPATAPRVERVPANTTSDDPFANTAKTDTNLEIAPPITLNLRNVSALQVLKAIMNQTGSTYKTSENTVTIFTREQK